MSDENGKRNEPDPSPTVTNPPDAESGPMQPDGDNSAVSLGGLPERLDLPKWNRARVKRKPVAGQEQDAFQGTLRQAGQQAVARAPLVLGVILLASFLVAGLFWYRDLQVERRAEATRTLAEAVAHRARGRVGDVAALTQDRKHPLPIPIANNQEELSAVVDKALGRLSEFDSAADVDAAADLVRASRAMEQASFTEAETAFRAFLAEVKDDHRLAFLAREGLVFAKEGQGDIEGALAGCEPLAGEIGDFYRDQGLYHKARLLVAADRADDARAVIERYVAEYPLENPSLARAEVLELARDVAPDLIPAGKTSPLDVSPVSPGSPE